MGSRLKRLSDHLFQEVQGIYQEYGIPISGTYFPILRLLQLSGAMSVMDMAEKLKVSHPAVSKQVTKMLKEGLLEKELDPCDQRRSHLKLSADGHQAMAQVEPILQEMKVVLDGVINIPSANFLQALEQVERQLLGNELTEMVIDRLSRVNIIPYKETHQSAFFALNMHWLESYFPDQVIEADYQVLEDPQASIIDKSGFVWMAIREGSERALGTLAMLPDSQANSTALLKLAVAEHAQGKGIAQRLMDQAIAQARQMGVEKMTLETASCLEAAKRLYEKNGFVEMPAPKPSLYERADVYMEKILEKSL
ncbi:bifunctional helix-turn-helix transcriptional regulator/GNAT family N-acetyltransferase [Marinomonas transparens]|nr:bifunctional helix-turn-helix transcriptional regulator/GNAT family N-acetyltransferase [Marinomonas transparens]